LGRVGEVEDEVFRLKKKAEDASQLQHERNMANKAAGNTRRGNEFDRERGQVTLQYMKSRNIEPIKHTITTQSVGVSSTFQPLLPTSLPPNIDFLKSQLAETLSKRREEKSVVTLGTEKNESAAADLRNKLRGGQLSTNSIESQTSKRKLEVSDDSVSKMAKDEVTVVSSVDSMEVVTVTECDGDINNKVIENQDVDDLDDEEDDDKGDIITAIIEDPIVSAAVAVNSNIKQEIENRLKAKQQSVIDSQKNSVRDNIRLHEQGWKSRYNITHSLTCNTCICDY
jgi:hypothetical protein